MLITRSIVITIREEDNHFSICVAHSEYHICGQAAFYTSGRAGDGTLVRFCRNLFYLLKSLPFNCYKGPTPEEIEEQKHQEQLRQQEKRRREEYEHLARLRQEKARQLQR